MSNNMQKALLQTHCDASGVCNLQFHSKPGQNRKLLLPEYYLPDANGSKTAITYICHPWLVKVAIPVKTASASKLYLVYQRSKVNVSLLLVLSTGSCSSSIATAAKFVGSIGGSGGADIRGVLIPVSLAATLENQCLPADISWGKTSVRKRPRTRELREIRYPFLAVPKWKTSVEYICSRTGMKPVAKTPRKTLQIIVSS
jgi:hypothetical protein